ncbi:MAG: hypothetical protein A2Y74_06095 [Actinobacteria bacterium RBG_13_63_9]|nr:MAG: hypothetical protein A2Y74_06095 [Actinobacteria bacterium RBG_13_63_9]
MKMEKKRTKVHDVTLKFDKLEHPLFISPIGGIHLTGAEGSVDVMYLASFPNELFRINRRRFGNLGMVFYRVLELAIAHSLVSYEDFIATGRPRAVPPAPPQARGHPPSLERPPANRPWRAVRYSV